MPSPSVGSSEERHGGPDPSQLTTAALLREIANLSDRVDLKIEGVVSALTARLDAIDKATDKFEDNLVRVPTETQKAVGHLQELMEEKFQRIENHLAGMQKLKDEQFRAIQQQFQERDVRSDRETQSGKEALDAALQAAKEAVGKSEVGQTKALEQQSNQIRTVTDANNVQITDLKERVTRIEAIGIGQSTQKQEQHMGAGLVVSLIGIGLAIISALIAASAFIRPR